MEARTNAGPRVAIACTTVGRVYRGFETLCTALFERLAGELDVTLFKGFGRAAPGERVLRCLRREGALGRAIAAISSPKKSVEVEYVSFALLLDRAIRGGRFDVVFTPEVRVGKVLAALRRLRPPRRPFAIAFHNSAPEPPRRCKSFDLVQQANGPLYETALAAGLARSRLLPLPVDTARFRPGPRPERLARALALKEGAPVVLCVAALEPFKRIELLVRALAEVPGEPAPELVVAGAAGRTEAAVRALAAEKLAGRAHFVRIPQAEMPELYRLADVFALPSRIEGFGLVLVEAMASGLPVVTQEDAERRFVVGDAGILLDCERTDDFARALAGLLGDAARRRELGARGRARASERFSWDLLLPRYAALLREAAGIARNGAIARAPA
jgi:glycosyltransferase involved in cell wall biosynthesis